MNLFVKKPISHITTESEIGETQRLKRTMGALDLVALGIGVIIGAGIFSLTGIAAAENAGPAVVFSFIIAAVACGLAGMCYSEFASMIPMAGSAYTYAYATIGEFMAWVIGWDLVLEYALGAAAVSVSWSSYMVSLLKDFNIHLHPQLVAGPFESVTLADGSAAAGLINLPAIVIISLASVLLMIGIKESSQVNNIIVVIKLTVIAVFVGIGVFYIKPENYVPFIPANTGTFGEYGLSGIMRAAGVIFFAYIGFDCVSTAAQETKNPSKNMPIGIMGSLIVCTVIYVVFALVLTGMVNYQVLKGDAAPVATAIDMTAFPWLKEMIKIGIIAGFSSVILVLLYGQSRIFFSMSRDGLLPKIFSDVHPKWHTPWRSNILFLFFVSAFAGFVPISKLGHMVSIGTLFAFVLVCLSVLILRYKQPDLNRPYRTPFVPWTPLAGIVVCMALMCSLGVETWQRLLIWLALGLVIYFGYSRFHSKLNANP